MPTATIYSFQSARDQRDAQSGSSAESLLILIEAEALAGRSAARDYREGAIAKAEALGRLKAATCELLELCGDLPAHDVAPTARLLSASVDIIRAELIINAPWPLHQETVP